MQQQTLTISSFVLSAKEKHKDKNPEQMNKLRDQLVGTFKEQMDIRWDTDLTDIFSICDIVTMKLTQIVWELVNALKFSVLSVSFLQLKHDYSQTLFIQPPRARKMWTL